MRELVSHKIVLNQFDRFILQLHKFSPYPTINASRLGLFSFKLSDALLVFGNNTFGCVYAEAQETDNPLPLLYFSPIRL